MLSALQRMAIHYNNAVSSTAHGDTLQQCCLLYSAWQYITTMLSALQRMAIHYNNAVCSTAHGDTLQQCSVHNTLVRNEMKDVSSTYYLNTRMAQQGKLQNISISMADAPSEIKAADIQSTSKAHCECCHLPDTFPCENVYKSV
jgi:hypothetical protein